MKFDCNQSEFNALFTNLTNAIERAASADANSRVAHDKVYKLERQLDEERGKLQAEIDALKSRASTTSYGEENAVVIARMLKNFAEGSLIATIKDVRQLTGFGLKEAKDLTEAAMVHRHRLVAEIFNKVS